MKLKVALFCHECRLSYQEQQKGTLHGVNGKNRESRITLKLVTTDLTNNLGFSNKLQVSELNSHQGSGAKPRNNVFKKDFVLPVIRVLGFRQGRPPPKLQGEHNNESTEMGNVPQSTNPTATSYLMR